MDPSGNAAGEEEVDERDIALQRAQFKFLGDKGTYALQSVLAVCYAPPTPTYSVPNPLP